MSHEQIQGNPNALTFIRIGATESNQGTKIQTLINKNKGKK